MSACSTPARSTLSQPVSRHSSASASSNPSRHVSHHRPTPLGPNPAGPAPYVTLPPSRLTPRPQPPSTPLFPGDAPSYSSRSQPRFPPPEISLGDDPEDDDLLSTASPDDPLEAIFIEPPENTYYVHFWHWIQHHFPAYYSVDLYDIMSTDLCVRTVSE